MSNKDERQIPLGLILHGIVIDRKKKMITKKDQDIEVVTYVLQTTTKRYFVDDYAPNGSYFDVDSEQLIPVYVKPYQKKDGSLSYTFNVQKESPYLMSGESF